MDNDPIATGPQIHHVEESIVHSTSTIPNTDEPGISKDMSEGVQSNGEAEPASQTPNTSLSVQDVKHHLSLVK